QRQQRQRLLMVDVLDLPALGQAGALGLLAFAALDVGAEAAVLEHDLLGRVGILAQRPVLVLAAVLARLGAELARIAALRIVRAADERAVLAELQRQRAVAAARAGARVRAVLARREGDRREVL